MTNPSTQLPPAPTEPAFGAWGHDEHAHPHGQFIYAVSGGCVLDAAGVVHPVGENRAVWIPPALPHSARFAPGFAPLVVRTGSQRWHPTPVVLTVSAELRYALLAALLADGDPRALVDAELDRALARPDRGILAVTTPVGPLTAPVAAALENDPADPRGLDDWALTLHASTASIRRAFREETGVGFAAWRTRRRLSVALELLAAGHLVGAVAARVGLSHHGLVAAFQRHLGRPPSAYAQPRLTARS